MKATGQWSTCDGLSCKTSELTGQAWHDHQWGDFDLSSYAGWDWFAVQFDNQTELMLYLIRQPDGTYSTKAGSFITADGRTLGLTQDDFDVTPTGQIWESNSTGAIYPIAWTLRVPKFGIDVLVNPVMLEQEMDTRSSTGIVYWEGAVNISGSHTGVGYVELTNYNLYPYGQTDTNTSLKPLPGPFGF
jgi:predicted secreted hydrolase